REYIAAPDAMPKIRELLHAFRVLGSGKISGVHRANRCATKSSFTPAASRTRSMPTWTAPRPPPPTNTNAVFPAVCIIEPYFESRMTRILQHGYNQLAASRLSQLIAASILPG